MIRVARQIVCLALIWECLFGQPLPAQEQERPLETKACLETYAHLVYTTYADCYNKALDLRDAVLALLNNPNEGTLAAARQAWITARVPYEQSETFRFYQGPIDWNSPQNGQKSAEKRLNAWPINESYIDYVKEQVKTGFVNDLGLPITEETLLDKHQQQVSSQVTLGYPAIEFLLWGQDVSSYSGGTRPASDYFEGSELNERRRKYLHLVTHMLLKDLKLLVDAWDPKSNSNYAHQLLKMDPRQALGKIITGMASLVGFELAVQRMERPLKSSNVKEEQSPFSDNSYMDYLMSALGVYNVYYGTYGKFRGKGLYELVKQVNPGLNQKIEQNMEQTMVLLSQIERPIDTRVFGSFQGSEARIKMEQAIKSLQMQAQLLLEMAKALDAPAEVVKA